MNKLSRIDVLPPKDYAEGYIAGFFDGEGFVSLRIQKNRPSPIIGIANTHVHVLNWLRALVFPLEEIDYVHLYLKNRQIRIFRWDQVEKFVNIFKDLCIVKREQLELMDEAIKKRRELISQRKGRRLYSDQDIEYFTTIAKRIKDAKDRIKNHWRLTLTSRAINFFTS